MRAIHLLCLFATACAPDGMIQAGKSSNEGAEQDIVVSPATLDFGGWQAGAESAEVVTISNVGTASLDLYTLEVGGSSAFTLTEDPDGSSLAPGEDLEVTLTYSPLGEQDEGQLQVRSSDPDQPLSVVELLGQGLLPELSIRPDPVTFDEVAVSLTDSETITVANTSEVDATLTEIAVVGGGFELTESPELPYHLAAGESLELEVSFTTTVEGDEFTGQLYVTSDEPSSPRHVDLTAYTTPICERVDEFYQGPFDSTDLLFYIDRSCSMTDDAALLAESFTEIVDALYETAFDYQVIVVTNDTGCYNEAIFTPETEDPEDKFLDAVFGTAGAWTEAGLTISLNALEATGTGGCNEGWLREGAKTNLVLISDEPEQSARDEDYYIDQILDLAPTTTITSIAGPVPDGCSSAEPGVGYDEAAEATGGELLPLCDGDWATWSGYLGETALGVNTDTFELRDEPIASTITVSVNEEYVSHWTYDSGTNAVIFDAEHVPEPEQHIEVEYIVAHECDDE